MKKSIIATLMLSALAVSGCASPPPQSNLDAVEMQRLFSGRVQVIHQPKWVGPNGYEARAFYKAPDGTTFGCGMNMRRKTPKSYHGVWKVVPDEKFGALSGAASSWEELDPDHRQGFLPITFNRSTGEVIYHSYVGAGNWEVYLKGHQQDSWPAVMLERCPDLKLPADLPINDKQTAHRYEDLVKQDPDAIIRVP